MLLLDVLNQIIHFPRDDGSGLAAIHFKFPHSLTILLNNNNIPFAATLSRTILHSDISPLIPTVSKDFRLVETVQG